jgi:hypothetical protein
MNRSAYEKDQNVSGNFGWISKTFTIDILDAACDFDRFVDSLLRIHKTAQLNDALVGFNADLE